MKISLNLGACKHRKNCDCYRENSYTCTKGEKQYCGIYRQFSQGLIKVYKQTPTAHRIRKIIVTASIIFLLLGVLV